MLVAIILFIVLLLLGGTLWFFFNLAFVRQDIDGLEDLDSDINKFLADYKPQVEEGMKFADEQPFEYVTVESFDKLKLVGKYYKNGESNRTIMLFHGYRSAPKRDFSCAIKMYYEMGLNVLLVDQRAHGKSEGRVITFGVKESRDVLSWIELILVRYGQKQIFLDGISMGATTVMLSTRFNLSPNVKGIIADCGFTSPVEIIKIVAKRNFHINGAVVLPVMNLLCKLFADFSLYEFSVEEVLKNSKIPIFILHGKKDGLVPFEMSERAFKAASAQKEIHLVDEADHGMSFLLDRENVSRKLTDFINRNSD